MRLNKANLQKALAPEMEFDFSSQSERSQQELPEPKIKPVLSKAKSLIADKIVGIKKPVKRHPPKE